MFFSYQISYQDSHRNSSSKNFLEISPQYCFRKFSNSSFRDVAKICCKNFFTISTSSSQKYLQRALLERTISEFLQNSSHNFSKGFWRSVSPDSFEKVIPSSILSVTSAGIPLKASSRSFPKNSFRSYSIFFFQKTF